MNIINEIYKKYPNVYKKFCDVYDKKHINACGKLKIQISKDDIILFCDKKPKINKWGLIENTMEEDLPFPFVYGLFANFFNQYDIKAFEYSYKSILHCCSLLEKIFKCCD